MAKSSLSAPGTSTCLPVEALVIKRSLNCYQNDKGCPFDWEPGGEDILSPCLTEADFMRRV